MAASCQSTLPLNMPLSPHLTQHPTTMGLPTPSEKRAAGWPGFYLLLSVRCCAQVSLAAPLHDVRLQSLVQSSGSLLPCCQLQLQWEVLWLPPSMSDSRLGGKGTRSKGKRRKRGRNTIKMSCIPTDQSLPTSHVLRLTWLPDKWRLEERRRWKKY